MKPEDVRIGDRVTIIPIVQVKRFRKEQRSLGIKAIRENQTLSGIYSKKKGTIESINGYTDKKIITKSYQSTITVRFDDKLIKEKTSSGIINAYPDEIKLIQKQLKLYKSILKIN